MPMNKLEILLVEDEENDIFFFRRAVANSPYIKSFETVKDGREAVQFLKREGRYAELKGQSLPNVVMTDLKMPVMNGFELLEWLKQHPECGIIPAMVYSSSTDEQDVCRAFKLGANAYFAKPTKLDEMVGLLHFIYEFWSRSEIPPLEDECK